MLRKKGGGLPAPGSASRATFSLRRSGSQGANRMEDNQPMSREPQSRLRHVPYDRMLMGQVTYRFVIDISPLE